MLFLNLFMHTAERGGTIHQYQRCIIKRRKAEGNELSIVELAGPLIDCISTAGMLCCEPVACVQLQHDLGDLERHDSQCLGDCGDQSGQRLGAGTAQALRNALGRIGFSCDIFGLSCDMFGLSCEKVRVKHKILLLTDHEVPHVQSETS